MNIEAQREYAEDCHAEYINDVVWPQWIKERGLDNWDVDEYFDGILPGSLGTFAETDEGKALIAKINADWDKYAEDA